MQWFVRTITVYPDEMKSSKIHLLLVLHGVLS